MSGDTDRPVRKEPSMSDRLAEKCETCDGDGYVDIVDDWGGVIGPAPCPNCSDDDPLEAVDAALSALDGDEGTAPELARILFRVQAIATRGVGPDTNAEQALATIAAYIEKRLARLDQIGKEQT